MKKPNGYDEVTVGGDYTPINLGGHHAGIVSVTEQQSSTGKDMLVVKIDFAKNDSQPHYFQEQYNNDTRDEKKWPYQATQYIVSTDLNGKCSKSFKSFITAFEDSNKCEVNFEAKDFCAQFKGKLIGVVYGEVEEEYNGEVKTRRRIRWFCGDSKVDSQNIPDRKCLNNAPVVAESGFQPIPEGVDEEIPW